MAAQRALAVDDDRPTRIVLEKALRRAGYEVALAEDGEAAAALLEGPCYDLVLTDLMLSGSIDGLRVLELAKQRSERTQVIMVTGYASVEGAVEAMKRGATDYMQKPIHFADLDLRLQRAIEYRQMLDETSHLTEAIKVTDRIASETIAQLENGLGVLRDRIQQARATLVNDSNTPQARIEAALRVLAE